MLTHGRALVSQRVARCNGAVDDCTCSVNDVNVMHAS
jgi:hypothetical protein